MTSSTNMTWTPERLQQQLTGRANFTLLDVRNHDEFTAWRIEGNRPISTINLPYFDFIELQGEETVEDAVARAIPLHLADKLPRSQPVLVVCAKGDTSAYLAEGLRRYGYHSYNLAGGMQAWGDYYAIKTIVDDPRLTILQVIRPARGCIGYLVVSREEAVIIDAARHTDIYLDLLQSRGWRVKGVFDTHLHADHISGGLALARQLDTDYWVHPFDAIHPIDLLPSTFRARYLEGGREFHLGDIDIRALHLPGHTLGMINFLVDEHYLLTGDNLFIDSIGRPDLGGRVKRWASLLYRSLQKIRAMPESIVVLPGHFSHPREADDSGCYRANLNRMIKHNVGFKPIRLGETAFTARILESLPEQPAAYDEIRRINTGLIRVDEARASELELGKNLCALAQQGLQPQHLAA